MSDKFAFSTDVDATTKREAFDEGRAYERGAADERERIAQSFDREAEWREEIEKHAPTLKGGALLFRSWAREIRLNGEINNTREGEGG